MKLSDKVKLLPKDPGCYLMKNKYKEIIYVGKAKNLKNRVSSYFTGAHDYKTSKMVSEVVDFDIIITSTEKESLILEINLIKEHRPQYNIIFMDDKSYPYLRLNREGLPKVEVSRDRKHKPQYIYFGPYPNAQAARDMAQILNESLPNDGQLLPNTKAIYQKFNREELTLSEEEITLWRQNLVSILNGNVKDFKEDLQRQMMLAAEDLNFELAQNLKEKLQAIDHISDRQQVQFSSHEKFDLFNFDYYQGYIAIVGLFVRGGRLLERNMAVEACLEEPSDALLSFIAQFYENQPAPSQVYVPSSLNINDLSDLLDVDVRVPQRGKKRALMEIAKKNAQNQLEDQFSLLREKQAFKDEAIFELENLLNIQDIHRIEIFDNSHLAGTFTVSSCVVYDRGEPNKNEYRRYRLQKTANDLEAMEEVLYRRYFRLLNEGKTMPDLIILDGGKQQIQVGLGVLSSLGLDIPIISLVKDDRHRTRAIILDSFEELEVLAHSSLFKLLAQMQDEVHRYVITYHRRLRSKAMTRSILDEVNGLGEVRKKKLYNKFKSLKGMRSATVEELSEVVPLKVAKDLYQILHLDWNDKHE